MAKMGQATQVVEDRLEEKKSVFDNVDEKLGITKEDEGLPEKDISELFSKPPEPEVKKPPSNPLSKLTDPLSDDARMFFYSYIIRQGDDGFTLNDIFNRMEEDGYGDLDEKDEEILDELVLRNRWRREFTFGKHSMSLATTSRRSSANSIRVIQEEVRDDDASHGLADIISVMTVARHLESVNGHLICGYDADSPEFHSYEAIKKRYEYCLDMSSPLLDALGKRCQAMVETAQRVVYQSLGKLY